MKSTRTVRYKVKTSKGLLILSPSEYKKYMGSVSRGTVKTGYKPQRITIIKVKASKSIFEKRKR